MDPSNLSVPRAVVRPTELPPQAPATVNTFRHPLAMVPSHVSVRYRALRDLGNGIYKGMELDAVAHNTEASYSGHTWQGLWVSDTEVVTSFDSTTRNFRYPTGGSGSVNFATAGNWQLVVRVSP